MSKLKQIELSFDFEAPVVEEESPMVLPQINTDTVTDNITSEDDTTETIVKISTIKTGVRGRKSIKAMEAEADLITIPNDEELFSKMYYTMNEVTQMFRANHSLIRFWENEFDVLKPRKNKKGDRLFRPEDIKNLEIIYYLLRVKKYTIDGAKDYIKNQKKHHQQFEAIQKLEALKKFLLEIKSRL